EPALDVLPVRVERRRLAPHVLGRPAHLGARVPHRQLAGLLLALLGRLDVGALLPLHLLALVAQGAALRLERAQLLLRLLERRLRLGDLVLALALDLAEPLVLLADAPRDLLALRDRLLAPLLRRVDRLVLAVQRAVVELERAGGAAELAEHAVE